MRILKGLRGIGVLPPDHDLSEALAKAQRLLEVDQLPAALLCLEQCLAPENQEDLDATDPDYAACTLLLADCQAECGLRRGDLGEVRTGLESMLHGDAIFPNYFENHPPRWPAVLKSAERFLTAALDPTWRPGLDKGEFLGVTALLAQAWYGLHEFGAAARVCERGLKVFPGDSTLLFRLAQASGAQGAWEPCVALTREALASGRMPATSPELIALMDEALQTEETVVHPEAEALKGEALRRAGRWDDAYASFTRAEARKPGGLPDFAVEGLLLTALRKRSFAEVERYGIVYGRRGFGAEGMSVVAAALRLALDRVPERKNLWLFWSQLCLHLGRLGESLQGVARTLGLDPSLAEGVLAGCRSLESQASETPTFRLGLARVIITSGDVHRGLEALQEFDSPEATVTGISAAADLCREALERDPLCLPARELLVRLLLRQNALEEALANGRLVLKQTGDTEAAAALTWRVGGASQANDNPAPGMAAREFEVEIWRDASDQGAALEAIQAMCAHPSATKATLERALELLATIPTHGPHAHRGRLVSALLVRRLGDAARAATTYLDLIRSRPEASVLEAACQGLNDLLKALPNRTHGLAALAYGWLELGRPLEARAPFLECLAHAHPEVPLLRRQLRRQRDAHPLAIEWHQLTTAVALATGAETDLTEALAGLRQFQQSQPRESSPLRELARAIQERSGEPFTQRDAVLLRTRAALTELNEDGLREICSPLLSNPPAWAAAVVDLLLAAPDESARALGLELRTVIPPPQSLDPMGNTGEHSPAEHASPAASATPQAVTPEATSEGASAIHIPEPALVSTDGSAVLDAAPPVVDTQPSRSSEAPFVAENSVPATLPEPPKPAPRRRSLRESLASETVELVETPVPPVVRPPRSPRTHPRLAEFVETEVPTSIAEPGAAIEQTDVPLGPASLPLPLPSPEELAAMSPKSRLAALLRSETVEMNPASAPPRDDRRVVDRSGPTSRAFRRSDPPASATSAEPAPLSGPAAEARQLMAQALEASRAKDYVTARQLLESALALHPEDRLIRYNLGLVSAKAGVANQAQPATES